MRPTLIAVLALLLLAGCSVPIGPTPTPDVRTSAGYRRATEARGAQVRTAIEALHAACATGGAANCAKALVTQEDVIAEPERLIRITKAPQGCLPLFSGYVGLMDNALDYRTTLRPALVSGSAATLIATDTAGYAKWDAGWDANARNLPSDPCK